MLRMRCEFPNSIAGANQVPHEAELAFYKVRNSFLVVQRSTNPGCPRYSRQRNEVSKDGPIGCTCSSSHVQYLSWTGIDEMAGDHSVMAEGLALRFAAGLRIRLVGPNVHRVSRYLASGYMAAESPAHWTRVGRNTSRPHLHCLQQADDHGAVAVLLLPTDGARPYSRE